MTTQDLLSIVDSLRSGIDPLTGQRVDANSCLFSSAVKSSLTRVRNIALEQAAKPNATLDSATVQELIGELTQLGFSVAPEQLAKIFLGSRSVTSLEIRALPAYGKYRSTYSRRALLNIIKEMNKAEKWELQSSQANVKLAVQNRPEQPWENEPFFTEAAFDHLSPELADDFANQIDALGLSKTTEQLPEYMSKARTTLPRAYEPWTKAEKALLVEAMCYTNQAEKIAELFGRSTNSIRSMGKQLIYTSRQQRA